MRARNLCFGLSKAAIHSPFGQNTNAARAIKGRNAQIVTFAKFGRAPSLIVGLTVQRRSAAFALRTFVQNAEFPSRQ
jgi:hypothetical protein